MGTILSVVGQGPPSPTKSVLSLFLEISGKGVDCMGAESFNLIVLVTFPLLRGRLKMALAQVHKVKNPRGGVNFS